MPKVDEHTEPMVDGYTESGQDPGQTSSRDQLRNEQKVQAIMSNPPELPAMPTGTVSPPPFLNPHPPPPAPEAPVPVVHEDEAQIPDDLPQPVPPLDELHVAPPLNPICSTMQPAKRLTWMQLRRQDSNQLSSRSLLRRRDRAMMEQLPQLKRSVTVRSLRRGRI